MTPEWGADQPYRCAEGQEGPSRRAVLYMNLSFPLKPPSQGQGTYLGDHGGATSSPRCLPNLQEQSGLEDPSWISWLLRGLCTLLILPNTFLFLKRGHLVGAGGVINRGSL